MPSDQHGTPGRGAVGDDGRRYDYDFDPTARNNTVAALFRLAREGGGRVLDLGCGPGVLAAALAAEGAEVLGADLDAEAVDVARSRGVDAMVVDLRDEDWVEKVAGRGPFDVLVLADVLEHLVEPERVLRTVRDRALLADGGFVLVSIPNATHEALLANLLSADFRYTPTGLLDATHVRWFTLHSFRRMAEAEGFVLSRVERIERTLEQTDHFALLERVLPDLRRQLRANEVDVATYQYVLRLDPSATAAELASLRADAEAAQRERVAEGERLRAELRRVEAERGEVATRVADLTQRLQEATSAGNTARAAAVEARREAAAERAELDVLRSDLEVGERRLRLAELATEEARRELADARRAAEEARADARAAADRLDELHSAHAAAEERQRAERLALVEQVEELRVAKRDLQSRHDEQYAARRRLREENERLAAKLEDVYESETFLLGKRILAGPRAVKKRLEGRRGAAGGSGARSGGRAARPVSPPPSRRTGGGPVHAPRLVEDTAVRAAYEAAIARTGFDPDGGGPRIAMSVSTRDLDEGRGDLYTAAGLGRQLVAAGAQVVYLEPERWHEPPEGTDVHVAMLAEPRYGVTDPLRLPPHVLRVAWLRNNTQRWLDHGRLGLYDLVLCSSATTLRTVRRVFDGPSAVLRIGVDTELFAPADPATDGVVATINQWGGERATYAALAGLERAWPLGIYGRQRELDPALQPCAQGPVPYFSLPSLYAASAVVLDDQQDVNRQYGNVNSRVYEALAVGALPVSDTAAGLAAIGLGELPVWGPDRALEDVVTDVLADPAARRDLVVRLREHVRREHSYAARAGQLLDLVGTTLEQPRRAPRAVLGFWPDYRVTNPFQDLLNEALPAQSVVPVALDRPRDLLDTPGLRGATPVLHLHWTAPVLNPAVDERDARGRARLLRDVMDSVHDRGGRVVWTVHNVHPHEMHHPELESRLRQDIADRADLVHVMTPATAELVRPHYTLPEDRVVEVAHGSFVDVYPNARSRPDARRAHGFDPEDVVLLSLGQIRPYKGLDVLVDAFERARGREPRLRLLVAGAVGRFPAARELCDRLAATDGVVLRRGEVADEHLQDVANAADVLVLAHRKVLNSGLVGLASAFALPVVAPRIGGLPDAVAPDASLLYDPVGAGLEDALVAAPTLATLEAREASHAHAMAWTHRDMAKGFADAVASMLAATADDR